jgi:AAA family ATP:ADP antiporter
MTRSNPLLTIAKIEAHEARAVGLAVLMFFFVLGSYYILRPVRDTLGTVYGVTRLQELYTGTSIATLLMAPVYGGFAVRVRLSVLLPGVYGFFLASLLGFYVLFTRDPASRWVAAAFYVWISTANLMLVSVFWTFMADMFSRTQAKRLFGLISAGGSFGAIAGPGMAAVLADRVGLSGLLLIAAAGFAIAIGAVLLLEREKARVAAGQADGQTTRLDHALGGNPFSGFTLLFTSRYLLLIALFVVMVSWVSTFVYFQQAALIAQSFDSPEARARVFAEVDLIVNIGALAVQLFGTARLAQRFGVTATLIFNPVVMVLAFLGVAISPTLLVLLAVQAVRRIAEYAVAKPGREMLFTIVDQQSKYKAKNVIDTAVYRLADVSSAWLTAGAQALGAGTVGIAAIGVFISVIWGWIALRLGGQYDAAANLGRSHT